MQLAPAFQHRIVFVTATVLLTGTLLYSVVASKAPAPSEVITTLEAAADVPDFELTLDEVTIKSLAHAPVAAAAQSSVAATTAQQARPLIDTYVVEPGDTVSGIASRFGLKANSVLWTNGLGEQDLIATGDELLIPAVDGVVYTIQSGDNLWDITSDHGGDMDEVIKINSEIDPAALQPGERLLIPNGTLVRRQAVVSRSGNRVGPSGRLDYWPATGTMTDAFGWRIHPVYGNQQLHDGIDLGLAEGTPLVAASSGTVTMASWFGGYGIAVRIDHGGGVVTQYSHMSSVSVSNGQRVGAGELVGYSGNTGITTGPHLHFIVLVNGSPDDPLAWLP